MDLKDYIKNVRDGFKLNQTEFAELVWPDKDPKTTQPNISKYERGISTPPGDTLFRIQELEKQSVRAA